MKNSGVASLRFLGATDTVTGSRYLLDHQGTRVLVDCGLFQGYKRLRERNRRPFPVSPSSIDAVLLTHAHLDHTGYLPLLVRDGFRGPVYSTQGTSQLSKLLLTDSGHLQEEEARHAAHAGSSQHDPVLPLYTALDATRSLQSFRPVDFDTPLQIGTGFEAVFVPAGHILGAAQIRLQPETPRCISPVILAARMIPSCTHPGTWKPLTCSSPNRPTGTGSTRRAMRKAN